MTPGPGPSRGVASAPVHIILFSDFECPYSKKLNKTIREIERTYDVYISWRNYPQPSHEHAQLAAEAFLAAHARAKAWQMHDLLFEHQEALSREDLEKYAKQIGLDLAKFQHDLDQGTYKDAVQKDFEYGMSIAGTSLGTPTVFINGRMIMGAHSLDDFKAVVDATLKR